MKLELKHLAPYLPYGLNYQRINRFGEIETELLEGKSLNDFYVKDIKPILRPLSDLTEALKDIYRFASNVEIKQYDYVLYVDYYLMDEKFNDNIYRRPFNFDGCPQGIYKQLIEHHFDVFGLIDKGLAIDINTLNK